MPPTFIETGDEPLGQYIRIDGETRPTLGLARLYVKTFFLHPELIHIERITYVLRDN